MLTEHTIGRDYVKGMDKAIAAYQAGDENAAASFATNARGYIVLLRQHIDKEDHILYPMADRALSAEKQDELSDGFERVERERVEAGRHEAFQELLHELDRVYLSGVEAEA